jgi:hypothetical protein
LSPHDVGIAAREGSLHLVQSDCTTTTFLHQGAERIVEISGNRLGGTKENVTPSCQAASQIIQRPPSVR